MKVDLNEEQCDQITKGELARQTMIEISAFFAENEVMTKEEFFDCCKYGLNYLKDWMEDNQK